MRKDVDNYLHSAFTKGKLVLSTQIKGRQRSTSVCQIGWVQMGCAELGEENQQTVNSGFWYRS